MNELYKFSDKDIKDIVTNLLYNSDLLNDYEEKIKWLNEMPMAYINMGKSYGDYPELDGDTLKAELDVRIGCYFGDIVEKELKKILQNYKYELVEKDIKTVTGDTKVLEKIFGEEFEKECKEKNKFYDMVKKKEFSSLKEAVDAYKEMFMTPQGK